MFLGLANSLFRLFREHSDVVTVDKLRKDGVRSVTVLDWSRIDRLIAKAVDEALKRRPGLKTLYTSGYTENAIVHHGRLDSGVLLLAKPYRKSELARMIRLALAS